MYHLLFPVLVLKWSKNFKMLNKQAECKQQQPQPP